MSVFRYATKSLKNSENADEVEVQGERDKLPQAADLAARPKFGTNLGSWTPQPGRESFQWQGELPDGMKQYDKPRQVLWGLTAVRIG